MQAQSHLQFLPHPETETLHHQGAHCIWWGDRHPGWAYLGQWFRGGGGLSAGGPPALGHPPTPPGTAAPGRLGPVGGAAGGGLRIDPLIFQVGIKSLVNQSFVWKENSKWK